MSILQHWPETKFDPRPVQVQALEWIEQQTAKYLIIQAPVASGKSHIAVTASAHFGNGVGSSYILTPQKVLQKQYDDCFGKNTFALYGKNNFECASKQCTCDIGSLIKPTCNSCPYTNAVGQALNSPNIVMNYKLALLMFQYHPKFIETRRSLMVVDECHGFEKALVDFDAQRISRRFVETELQLPWPTKVTNVEQLCQWMVDGGYQSKLTQMMESLEGQVDTIQRENRGRRLSKDDVRTIRKLFRVEEMVVDCSSILVTDPEELLMKRVFDYNESQFELKSLYGRDNFHLIEDKADRFLFMSGTVDFDGFCDDMGIPKDQAAFLSLESPIPADNRPVMYVPTIRMNYEWSNDENKPHRANAINMIKHIITQQQPEDSGVIHTTNFRVAEWIRKELADLAKRNHITLVDHSPDEDGNATSRDEAIERYMDLVNNGHRAILISPSCTEGLDLKYELGRFSIILKVPYGNLGDKWVKRRMELSSAWYARQALNQTLQAAGRVVRDPSDYGVTYILDSNWSYLLSQTKRLIPHWWRQAYQS